MTAPLPERTAFEVESSTGEPILCRCRAWREGRLSDHRNHRAEYRRALAAGLVPDAVWAAAIEIEAQLSPADLVP